MDKHGKNCGARRQPSDTHIADLDVDPFDYGFLCAARYFFVAFSGETSCWVHTILNADQFFPGTNSTEAVRAALGMVQEMRQARKSCFHFSNPRCPCCAVIVTVDERHLLQLLQRVRTGEVSKAASSAMLLCEGYDTDRLMHAAAHLASFAPPPPEKARRSSTSAATRTLRDRAR